MPTYEEILVAHKSGARVLADYEAAAAHAKTILKQPRMVIAWLTFAALQAPDDNWRKYHIQILNVAAASKKTELIALAKIIPSLLTLSGRYSKSTSTASIGSPAAIALTEAWRALVLGTEETENFIEVLATTFLKETFSQKGFGFFFGVVGLALTKLHWIPAASSTLPTTEQQSQLAPWMLLMEAAVAKISGIDTDSVKHAASVYMNYYLAVFNYREKNGDLAVEKFGVVADNIPEVMRDNALSVEAANIKKLFPHFNLKLIQKCLIIAASDEEANNSWMAKFKLAKAYQQGLFGTVKPELATGYYKEAFPSTNQAVRNIIAIKLRELVKATAYKPANTVLADILWESGLTSRQWEALSLMKKLSGENIEAKKWLEAKQIKMSSLILAEGSETALSAAQLTMAQKKMLFELFSAKNEASSTERWLAIQSAAPKKNDGLLAARYHRVLQEVAKLVKNENPHFSQQITTFLTKKVQPRRSSSATIRRFGTLSKRSLKSLKNQSSEEKNSDENPTVRKQLG